MELLPSELRCLSDAIEPLQRKDGIGELVGAGIEHRAGEVEAEGLRCVVADTIMSSPEKAAILARSVLDAGR